LGLVGAASAKAVFGKWGIHPMIFTGLIRTIKSKTYQYEGEKP
jgi:hypothetical protein